MTEESGERQVGTPEGRKARLEERHRQRQEAETEARERLAGLGAQDNGEPDFHRSGERGAEAPTEAEAELRDAIVGRLRASGIEVVTDSEAGQRVLDEANGKNVMLNARKKKSLETDSVPQEEHQRTVISSDDGAKVLNNLDDLIKEYENSVHTKEKTFIGNAAKALGAKRYGSKSEYATFETVNGNEVTIRLSDHNASVERMDKAGRDNAISIVVTPKPNSGILDDGNAHIVEFYYNAIRLRRAEGKPLVEILKSIKQALYSGEFKDTTGLADVDVKNADRIREQRAAHGSGADFDHFDFSYMGTGEGAQFFGYGGYCSQVDGISIGYAKANRGKSYFIGDKGRLARGKRQEGLVEAAIRVMEVALNSDFYFGQSFEEIKQGMIDGYSKRYTDITRQEYADRQRMARIIERMREEDFELGKSYLYTLEIPDDNGSNYLHWEKPVTEAQIKKIQAYLDKNYRRNKLDDFNASIAPVKTSNADEVNAWSRRGENIYKTLSHLLGGDKAASEAFSEMGFTGISYPAEYLSGGRPDGARNFVIFKESDMKITGKVKFFRTPQGEAYGFTVGGKIYLDPRIAKADTPIHEYAHLWASALREGNPEEWSNVVRLMKGTPVWEEVKKLYPELETDEEIADEVLATYSGRRGAERLRETMREAGKEDGLGGRLAAKEAVGRVREALQRFWHAVADFLHIRYSTAEEVADRVLKDLLDGVKPGGESQRLRLQSKDEALFSGLTPEARSEMEAIRAEAQAGGTYMKAPNGKPTNLSERQWLQVRTKAFKEWFGDWEKKSMKDYLLHGKPVSGLTGNEFQKDGIPLTEKVGKFYQNEYGGKVTREGFGEVVLDERGVKDSLSHGIGRVKSAAFAAVPSIITDGRIVSTNENWKGRNYDSYTFAAPVKIGTETYVGVVVVTRGKGKNENRFYLHEVVLQKSLQDRSVKTGTEADSHHGDIAKVLKNIVSASDDVSKVVDENGEPLVVYHGTPLRRDQITPNRGWQRDGTYVRQKAPFHTFKGGEYSGMIFTSVEAAKARSIAEKRALSIPDNADGTEQWTEEGYVYDLFVNVKNPFVPQRDAEGILSSMGANIPTLSFYGGEGESVPLDVAKEILESGNSWIVTETPQFIEKVRESGYDGLYGKDEGVDYIACFAPNQLKDAYENNGTFSAMNDDIRFRQQGGRGEATDMESKRAAVEALGRKLNVEVVFEDEASLRKQPRQYRTASGWFDRAQWRKDGRRVIHVNLSNTGDAHEAEMTVLHEAVGHMGLRELLGAENYDPFLDMVHGIIPEAQAGRLRALVFKGHPDLARRVGEGNADGKDRETAEAELRRVMADEWLAELAEVGGEPGVWEQIVESFRMLLRRLGFELSLSESDIRALLFESRRNLESSRLPGEAERIREQQEEFREAARLDRIMEADMADMEADAGSEASSFRQWYGGNSGYVGYSMSRRAAEAREEGRFPKTDFKKEYHVSEHALKALVRTGFIDGSEWHHTSKYGNRTPFYGWTDEASAQTYLDNKKEVDALSKEYDGLGMASPDNNAGLFLEERMSSMRKERGYGMDFLTDGEKAERSRRLDEIGIADFGMDEAERARINAASEAVIDEYRELSGRRIREMESEIQGMDEYKNRVEEEGRKEARRKDTAMRCPHSCFHADESILYLSIPFLSILCFSLTVPVIQIQPLIASPSLIFIRRACPSIVG